MRGQFGCQELSAITSMSQCIYESELSGIFRPGMTAR